MTHVWPDGSELNAQLRDSILAHARRHPGTDLTNVGGWHSEPETLEFCGNAGQRLIRHMDAMIKEATLRLYAEFARPPQRLSWILSAWANVNRRGDFNQLHTHPGASWSGVYYVDHGESNPDADGTAIHLFDPNPARTNIFFPELFRLESRVQAGARLNDPVSELCAASGAPASRRPPPDFDRLQRPPGAFPMTAAASLRCDAGH